MPVQDGLVIGRVKPADLVLADGKVSRQHARVIVESGVVEVEDLDSRNGTRINGQTISRRLLRDGDVLECGGTSMTFREVEASSGVGLDEADELTFDEPVPATPKEPVASAPVSVPPSIDPADDFDEISFDEPATAPRSPQAPASQKATANLVEFEDEVVEVRSAPATRPSAASAMAQRSVAADRGASGNLLSQDIDQLGGGRRLMVNILAVLVALAVGYGAYLLAA